MTLTGETWIPSRKKCRCTNSSTAYFTRTDLGVERVFPR